MGNSHLILYDGVCGLCHRLVGFVLRRDARGLFCFASLQSDLGRALVKQHGGDPDALVTFRVLSDFRTASPALLSRADAALFLLKRIDGPWRVLGLMSILPGRVLDWGYDLVARNRYRLFGRYEHCFLPDAESRGRFIDARNSRESDRPRLNAKAQGREEKHWGERGDGTSSR
jgi:predicted DCC family thiol-disulfide oxidoreductase YuxK